MGLLLGPFELLDSGLPSLGWRDWHFGECGFRSRNCAGQNPEIVHHEVYDAYLHVCNTFFGFPQCYFETSNLLESSIATICVVHPLATL